MRYGDLDALFNERPEYLNPQHETNGEYNRGWNACNEHYSKLIRNAPTADVAPVVHGRWEEKQIVLGWCEDDVDIFYTCSVCGAGSPSETFYCPNCGAKMYMKGE